MSDVKEDSPAEKAGIKQGDVIIGYDGLPVEDAAALQRVVTRTPIGAKATIKVLRDGHEKELVGDDQRVAGGHANGQVRW